MKKIISMVLTVSMIIFIVENVFASNVAVSDPLQLKLEEYLQNFPENSPDREMFLREVNMLKDYDEYNEEGLEKVYQRFAPIDASSLPEIVPIELPDEDAPPDESTIIRISEEERERNAEENQQLLDSYAEMMEGMTDAEAIELGINEEIIKLVRLREMQAMEEPLEAIQDGLQAPMRAAAQNVLSSANTTSKAPMIASGMNHNVYLKADGTVWIWGGHNSTAIKPMMDTYTIPTRIEMLTDIIEVAAVENYSLALSSSGVVYAWGAYTGKGYGSRDPIIVNGLSDIISIDAGLYKSLALRADGTVYEWTTGTFCAKQVMEDINTPLDNIKKVAAGHTNLYALKTNGDIVTWSNDDIVDNITSVTMDISNAVDVVSDTQGLALTSDGRVYKWEDYRPDYIELVTHSADKSLPVTNASAIYSGFRDGAIVTNDGSLYAFGTVTDNLFEVESYTDIYKIEEFINPHSISIGFLHMIVVKNDGSIWGIGHNNTNQLGIGDRSKFNYAKQMYNFTDVKQIDGDKISGAAVRNDGTVWTWGTIQNYQYGYIEGQPASQPMQVIDMDNNPITNVDMVKIGSVNGYILKDGMVWSWGAGGSSLGRGTYSPINKAAPVRTSETGNPYLTDIVSIAAYDHSAMAVDSNGDVWAWGTNSSGQLGFGDKIARSYATKLSKISLVEEISLGNYRTMALDCDGNVWVWGSNSTAGYIPEKIDPSIISNIKAISAGNSLMALGTDGYVWMWENGSPVKSSLGNIAQIATNGRYFLAIDNNGNVWAWGYNFFGQLGDKTRDDKNYPVRVLTADGQLENVISISAGSLSALALKSNGAIWVWGYGIETADVYLEREFDWTRVMNMTPRITQISSKQYHSLALKSDGTVWASGYNAYSQIGNPSVTAEQAVTPVQVVNAEDSGYLDNIMDVKAGDDASFALTRDGKVLAWGYNDRGKLGQPLSSGTISTPTYVRGASGTGQLSNIIAIDCGSRHTIALSSDGKVYAWGDNTYRQLGDGTGIQKDVPVEVSGLTDVIAISAYGNHSLALKSDGTVWAWGQNDLGQLGTGTTSTYESIPVQVKTDEAADLNGVKRISAGYNHNIVLKDDGTVWVWGHNDSGQLGSNNTAASYYAKTVSGIENASAVFAGARATYAIVEGDILKAWGQNTDGKLGNNSTVNSLLPVNVSTPSKVSIKTIIGSWNNAAAITADGQLLMWGTNSDGQFGIGSSGNISKIPVNAYVEGITYNDYGSSFDSAVEVIPNKIVPGEIVEENEADYFKFTADFTGKHVIDVTGDVSLELYDNTRGQILPLNLAYTLTGGETYYIKITSDAVSTYTFIIRSMNPDPFFARYSFKSGFINPAEITSLTSGHVEGHLVVANDYIEPRDVLVGLILYEKSSNAVHSVALVEKTMLPQTSETFILGVQVPADYTNYRIKAVIWDSREDMNQLGEEIIFE